MVVAALALVWLAAQYLMFRFAVTDYHKGDVRGAMAAGAVMIIGAFVMFAVVRSAAGKGK